MTTYTITSNDTLTLNDRVFTDLSLDDVVTITFPSDKIGRKTGKNGNTIFAPIAQGQNSDLVLRLARGSSDDQFLQALINSTPSDFPALALLNGTFVKRLGDGNGTVVSDVYTLQAGVISKEVEGKENVSGDFGQGEAVYNIKFASAQRSIG